MASAPPPPPRTPEQRRAASARAALARTERSRITAGLRTGAVTAVDVFERVEDGDRVVAKMRTVALVAAFPQIGSDGAQRLLGRLHIPANRRLRGLGPHQRSALISALRQPRATASTYTRENPT